MAKVRQEPVSSPDPDLASTEGEVFSAGGLDSRGLDRGGVRATGWFSQTEGRYMLACKDKYTQAMSTALNLSSSGLNNKDYG